MRRSPTPLPPMAYRVAISGTLSLGATLTGSYIFSDPNAHAEGASTFRWLRDGAAIGGATAITRVVAAADMGTSLVFEVTPVAATAPTTGVAARSDAVAISSDPEQHYLPFNAASSDWAYADHALDGIESGSDGWTLIIKVYGRPSVASNKVLASIYDEEVASVYANLCDAYVSSANKISGEGLRGLPTPGLLYSKTLNDTTTAGVQVIAVKHRNAATQHYDVTIAQAGATLETFGADFASNENRSPLHLALASCGLKTAGVHTPVALAYLNMNVIAVGVVQGIASEAEIQAYSIANNARTVWGGNVWTYYPMSLASGAAVANAGARSSAPLTLVGPIASELVAL